MSPSPIDGTSIVPPYTPTSGVEVDTFLSFISTKSDMAASFATSMGDMASMGASMVSAMSAQAAGATVQPGSSSSRSETRPTTFSRSTISSQTDSVLSSAATSSSAASANNAPNPTSAATQSSTSASNSAGATSAANNATNDLQKEQSSMSSPGMQAAVAVPVVIVILAAAALIFFCMRRRRKRGTTPAHQETEKAPVVGKKNRWTHHLRVFSFDTELLMGGRYSSTNSIRSRQTGSLRSGDRSQHSGSPSVHSVEDVAPPYRDAISTAQHPNIASIIAGGAAGAMAGTTAGVNRSSSNATAPPPYGDPASRLATPTSAISGTRENPFADAHSPVSPVDGSPFNDPPGQTPTISRNSSVFYSERDDVSSIGDAASIRQATVARNASVMSGGRIIDNVSRNSQ